MSGHYSPSLRAGPWLFVSGQVAPPALGDAAAQGLESQVRQCLGKLRGVLEAGGSSIAQVVKVTVYLADMNDMASFERVYAAFFGAHRPVRTLVPTGRFPNGILVEIDAIAVLPG